jgi:hypothetical protein
LPALNHVPNPKRCIGIVAVAEALMATMLFVTAVAMVM